MSTNLKQKRSIGPENGYVLLELLFYVSFFAAMSLTVISAMLTMAGSFRETVVHARIAESSAIMERMSREIRGAEDIITINATNLKLSGTDEGGSPVTMEFSLDGTDLELLENDVLVGNLNAAGVNVSSLSFIQVTTNAGKAVKVALSLALEDDKLGRNFEFYDTIVLRGNY